MANTSTLIREYVWFEGAVIEGGVVYYVRSDHIGKPVFATDATGTKVWEATYLPFGGVHTSTGANTTLRFPGQWFQSESGLHQNWMRDYDPTTGRYIQPDPLGLVDGASVYGYAGQNPNKYIDMKGEQSISIGGGFTPPGGFGSSRPVNVRKLLRDLSWASHNYNPIDWALQYCFNSEALDCNQEWEEAREICRSLLDGPNPPRGLTGGYSSINECAKGFVPEQCGGNRIER